MKHVSAWYILNITECRDIIHAYSTCMRCLNASKGHIIEDVLGCANVSDVSESHGNVVT